MIKIPTMVIFCKKNEVCMVFAWLGRANMGLFCCYTRENRLFFVENKNKKSLFFRVDTHGIDADTPQAVRGKRL